MGMVCMDIYLKLKYNDAESDCIVKAAEQLFLTVSHWQKNMKSQFKIFWMLVMVDTCIS